METLADFGTVSYFGVEVFTTGIFKAWLSHGRQRRRGAALELPARLRRGAAGARARESRPRRLPRPRTAQPRGRTACAAPGRAPRSSRARPRCCSALPCRRCCSASWRFEETIPAARLGALVGEQLRYRCAHGANRRRHRADDGLRRAPDAQPAGRGSEPHRRAGLRGARRGDRGRRAGTARPARQRACRVARGRVRRAHRAAPDGNRSRRWSTPTSCGCWRWRCRRPKRGSRRSRPAWRTPPARSAPARRAALARVHVPLLAPSLATAALLVFVDVLKELPATFALRPFNFDTLAVEAYNLAKDERLAEAAAAFARDRGCGLTPGDLRLEALFSGGAGVRQTGSGRRVSRALGHPPAFSLPGYAVVDLLRARLVLAEHRDVQRVRA